MRVLVTGATGLVGRRLVERLLERGDEVVALTTNVDKASTSLPVRCDLYVWDPGRGNIDVDAFDGVDAVVHLAGAGVADRPWSHARKREILASRIDSTHILLGCLGDLPPERRPGVFVGASAVGYYGDRGDEVLDETSDPGLGFLAHVCVAWESELAQAESLGMRAVGMRTGVVLAREGGALARMLPVFRLGLGGRLGSGRQWMSWIHREDLVSLFLFALDKPALVGPVNAVAPQPVPQRQFARALGAALRRPAWFPVPAALLRAVLGEMSSVLLDGQRVEPVEAAAAGFGWDYPTLEQALEELCADFSSEMRREFWLDRSPEEVFPFFADARNLELITPPFLHFRIDSIQGESVSEGTGIDYRLRLHGVPLRWRSRIEVWDPPRSFVDMQVRGPYRLWHHTHDFEELDGGTVIRDRVRYELPMGAIGAMVAGRLVSRDLDSIFAYRQMVLQATFPPRH